MQTEIEIKFFVTSNIQASPLNLLNSLEIISSNQAALGNVYFDTPDLGLRGLEMGLRIRRSDDFSEQTIKCRGQVVGGLHATRVQRPGGGHHSDPVCLSCRYLAESGGAR
jgi:triphosphatase